jgi:branched-chain amino acid aminotransferase
MPSGEDGVPISADAFAAVGPALLPFLAYEIGRGNTVAQVTKGLITLKKPIDLDGAKNKLASCTASVSFEPKDNSISAGGIKLQGEGGQSPWTKGGAYVNGEYVPLADAKISITDWGYRRSDVTYDVVSVYHGAFFRLDDHIKRFRRSMTGLRMQPKETDEDIKGILHKVCLSLGRKPQRRHVDSNPTFTSCCN